MSKKPLSQKQKDALLTKARKAWATLFEVNSKVDSGDVNYEYRKVDDAIAKFIDEIENIA